MGAARVSRQIFFRVTGLCKQLPDTCGVENFNANLNKNDRMLFKELKHCL